MSSKKKGIGCCGITILGFLGMVFLIVLARPKQDDVPPQVVEERRKEQEAKAEASAVAKAETKIDPEAKAEERRNEMKARIAQAKVEAEARKPQAIVVRNQLVGFISPENGQRMQMLSVTLKNTGLTPIRSVDARITYFDFSDKIIGTHKYSVYAKFDNEPGILPGHFWTTPKGEGIIPQAFVGFEKRLKSARVNITEVSEKSGM